MTITENANRDALLSYLDFTTAVSDAVNAHAHLPGTVLYYGLLQKANEVAACMGLPQQWRVTPLSSEVKPETSSEARTGNLSTDSHND